MIIPSRGVLICACKHRRSISRYLAATVSKLSIYFRKGCYLPRLKDVQVGGDAWKRELEDEDGRAESWVALLAIDKAYSFLESV